MDIDSLLGSTFQRTSVTIDEAVAMLLGWIDGPVEFHSLSENPTEEEQELLDSLTFSLPDAIEDKHHRLESELEDAKERKLPKHVIDEKRAAFRAFPEEVELARTYRLAIEGELNEGDASTLRLDTRWSGTPLRLITLSSFYRWSHECSEVPDLKAVRPKGKAAKPTQRAPADDEPWWIPKPGDPEPEQPWYTPARYFARELIEEYPHLRDKRELLAPKVVQKLTGVGIMKRGGKEQLKSGTVLKAFSKVVLG